MRTFTMYCLISFYCYPENKGTPTLILYLGLFFSLCKGIKFHRRTIGTVITGIWLYASLWALLPLLGWGSYGPEPFGLACSIDWIGYEESLNHSTFIMALATLCTFLPCVIILCTYFGIAWKLHRAYQSIQSEDFKCCNIERKMTLVKSSST